MRNRDYVVIGLLMVLMAGCSGVPIGKGTKTDPAASAAVPDSVRPVARPDDLGGQKVVGSPQQKGALGMTTVSLGTPTEPGLWLKTPLVSQPVAGQVSQGGKTVNLQLLPIEGATSAGSRMSLEAMRALGLPLTGLVEVFVTAL